MYDYFVFGLPNRFSCFELLNSDTDFPQPLLQDWFGVPFSARWGCPYMVSAEFQLTVVYSWVNSRFGCGKTRLIASMVAVMNEAFPRSRIFVTSETNSAIDEDLQRVVDEGRVPEARILRLGDMPVRTPEKYRRFYYHERIEMERQAAYAKAKNAYERQQVSAYIR